MRPPSVAEVHTGRREYCIVDASRNRTLFGGRVLPPDATAQIPGGSANMLSRAGWRARPDCQNGAVVPQRSTGVSVPMAVPRERETTGLMRSCHSVLSRPAPRGRRVSISTGESVAEKALLLPG